MDNSSHLSEGKAYLPLLNDLHDETMGQSESQPISSTLVIVFTILTGCMLLPIEYMYYLVFKMGRRDKTLLNSLLPSNACIYLVGAPIMYIFGCIIVFLPDPAKDVIGVWFCHIGSVFLYTILFRAWIFSLLVSILRYLYVVHHNQIKQFGLRKLERIFITMFWLVPLTLMVLHHCMRASYDPTPWINHCYGNGEMESTNKVLWYKIERQFCVYNHYDVQNIFIQYSLRILCGINVGASILAFSNLSEAFFYYRIYMYLKT